MNPHFGNKSVRGRRAEVGIVAGLVLFLVLLCVVAPRHQKTPGSFSATTLDSDHLYNLTNVWTIHLKFAPDEWDAMEPKGGFSPFGRGPGGRPPGFGFDAARSLMPVIMSQA